jgi:orotidine-5'-phosphate decarboxylase
MTFKEKLLSAAQNNNSWLCIGLDPDTSLIPEHLGRDLDGVLKFNRAVIEATRDLVCAYKPNAAFYECLGPGGWELLIDTIKSVPDTIPVILDFKRGDIGNTARMYAKAAFDIAGADAVTVNPYMGSDAIQPFLNYREKGVFVLCLTSNPSAAELQKKILLLDDPPSGQGMSPQSKAKTFAEFFNASTTELYLYLASLSVAWNQHDNLGLVVGATAVSELKAVRKRVGGNMPILIPGVGAQGGDLENSLDSGSNEKAEMAIINVARDIIYAYRRDPDNKPENFPGAIRASAENYRNRILSAAARKIKYLSR